MSKVTISLGANLSDKREAIREAVERIEALPKTRVIGRSRDYRTPPWGNTDQDWFVNAALVLETDLEPHALMAALLAIEEGMGRVRDMRWGPRRIDIDIISYDSITINEPNLTLPHPRALERAFVLVPLAEIAPDQALNNIPIKEALSRLDTRGIEPLPETDAGVRLDFSRAFAEPSGVMQRVSPRVRRLIAPNAGPFTFTGTCTYVVGTGEVTVIDPGPLEPSHIENIVNQLAGETIATILVTHTHRDHSPGAKALKELTDAPIIGCAPHRTARPTHSGDLGETGADRSYTPDRMMADGDVHHGKDHTLTALWTPGHTDNHLCFSLAEENALFSGDHVMAWSSTVVIPPDGSMRDYMTSLERLRDRPEAILWPGHGGPVHQPQRFVRALHHHRRMREVSIVNRIAAGDRSIADIVSHVYEKLDPRLTGAAGMAVLAHLEDLVERGIIRTDGPPSLNSTYTQA